MDQLTEKRVKLLAEDLLSRVRSGHIRAEDRPLFWCLWSSVTGVHAVLSARDDSPEWKREASVRAREVEKYAQSLPAYCRWTRKLTMRLMSTVPVVGVEYEEPGEEEPEVSWKATPPTSTEALAIRWAVARRRLFATGPFPRSATWQRDLLDRWEREDEVGEGVEEDKVDEEEKSIDDNPTINGWDLDEEGHLIIRGARIGAYLGEVNGRQQYVLSLPRGTGHQTGPYAMYREVGE